MTPGLSQAVLFGLAFAAGANVAAIAYEGWRYFHCSDSDVGGSGSRRSEVRMKKKLDSATERAHHRLEDELAKSRKREAETNRLKKALAEAEGRASEAERLRRDFENAQKRASEAERLKRDLENARKRASEAEARIASGTASSGEAVRKATEERDEARRRLAEERRKTAAAEASRMDLEREKASLVAKLRDQAGSVASSDSTNSWMADALGVWRSVDEGLERLFGGGRFSWWTTGFRHAVLQALASTVMPVEPGEAGATVNGTPDEVVLRIDGLFYDRLHGNGDLALLDRARHLYFDRFNDRFSGRYEIRWPKEGNLFDETWCRPDRDNGYTMVRVAISCAIFVGDGELKRKARVETVPRA